LGGDGQAERERRASTGLALEPDPAAVVLDDLAADRQPEARTTWRLGQRVAGLGELREAPGLVFGGDAGAGVGDADDDARPVVGRGRADRDGAGGRELHRVRQE